ncbi:non-ribosomal peptide synthetase [Burkholderia sp. Leaf177]|uniref:non-ribosomal peptide synthetase n=1 Tax=Burkholderia sp. Leaf177 TaxID=1736287 RepID=UPI0006FAE3A6|nr:non-ribosomal peptide synthetase [Burkholderia sp. Leaf177]KQR78561.1 non-ribosomal peptide synthetase [Burkholderia sp. Leaf177]
MTTHTTCFPTALHLRISALARLAPDAPAMTSFSPMEKRLSRGELDWRAENLASQLRAAGVGTEVRVGVCVERSCELFVALLAVLKAGGVFVPLDPHHPASRLDWIVKDAGLVHGIVDVASDETMRQRFSRCLTVSSEDVAAKIGIDQEPDQTIIHPRAAAYMIYTSGSTGTPKAVVVEHGPLAAHCEALAATLPIEADDRLLHFASVNFDAAHECWLAPLAVGASIVITDPPPFSPDAALAMINREQVNIAAFPPAYLREFAALAARSGVPVSLRVLAFGGEALSQDAFDKVRRVFPAVRLVNGYGPTEAIISPMLWPVAPGVTPELSSDDAYAPLPIGWALGPRAVHIGDADELLLGGACLARGYHGRAALTAERFLPDESGEPGTRIYRTGDRARRRPDGAYDYLGRIDDQVQVRGVRVEPGEIAACLRAHPLVRDAAVLADSVNGRTVLTACIVAEDELDDATIKAYVEQRLPDAWQPHQYTRLDHLQYTLNGKLDRDALRLAVSARVAKADANFAAPRTDTERWLAACWQRILSDASPFGLLDRFFDRGGDSLAAMQLQATIRSELGINLRLDTLFDDPQLDALAALIDRSERESGTAQLALTRVSSLPVGASFIERPASFAQQRFWVLAQTQNAGSAYHIAGHWTLRGALNTRALQQALDLVIGRHEAWRTTLVENDDGVVMQRIHATLPVRIGHVNLSHLNDTERNAQSDRLAQDHAADPFDLSKGPLLRATLVEFAIDSHRLMLAVHHSVSDGWSSRCAFDELARAYTAFTEGRDPQLPPLPIQYADYAHWQRKLVEGAEGARQIEFWCKALDAAPEPLALPYDRARPAERDHRGARVALRLDIRTTIALRELAHRAHASPFTVLLAAFDAWLYRLTGATDLVVAVPVAHRQRAETAPLIGLFLNTLALRAKVEPLASFEVLIDSVRATSLNAFAHQDVPFDQVLDAIKPPVRRGEEWLRVKFAQQFDAEIKAELPGLSAVATPGPDLAARFDFALDFTDDSSGIELVAAYALDCIDAPTAEAWLASFAALVADAVRNPKSPVALLDCANPFNGQKGRTLAMPCDDVLSLIAAHAVSTPQHVAVADDHTQLTCAELDDASNRVAVALQRRGAGVEQPVVVCIERSVRFVVALLGVLKSGAYAVLLDPAMPSERLAAAADACGAQLALVASSPLKIGNAHVLDIDAIEQDESQSTMIVKRAPLPDQAAYLIFTSGSTGTPKGVVVSHRALADYVQGMLDELDLAPNISMAMVSTVAADLGHTTLFGALCSGRTLHLLPASCAFDPDRFAQEMRTREVGVLKIVPSHLHALLDAQRAADVLPSHALITGGEILPWALVDRIAALKPGCRVINHYGPTETTVGSLVCDTSGLTQADLRSQSIPVGRPLPNACAYVFDAFGSAVPVGGIGELYLGGPGVARGYLGRAAATAEKFVPHPGATGERLYKTGDRVRLRADGCLDFLGRLDDQVKIRGYRVEPGEVSAMLRTIDGVAQAETLAVEQDGRLRLACFVTLNEGSVQTEAALRETLAQRVPEYMIPAVLAVLDTLPVTPNGKVDRTALREIAATPIPVESIGDATRGTTENTLATVWIDVLKIERVGRDDNFFELGGDSILVLQVIARSRKRGVRFTPKQLFDNPTIAQLATVATSTDAAVAPKPTAPPRVATDVLTPAQLRFFALDMPQRGHWNQSVQFDTQTPFDLDAFARAFDALLMHHEIFSQRFVQRPGSSAWSIVRAEKPFDTLPLAVTTATDQSDALAQFDALQCTLDIANGPLVCALVATFPDGGAQLYLAIHHLIIDGVSWRILLEDLDTAYRAATERRAVRLSPASARAQDWAARLARAAREPGSPFAQETSYWSALSSAYDDLPIDHPEASATNADALVFKQTLDADLTRALLSEANAAYRTQTIEILVAALAHAIGEKTGQTSCRIELEGHGREPLFDDIDASRTLGWLTSHYPVALHIGETLTSTLTEVKDALRAVPNKGVGFGVLRHYGDDAIRHALEAIPRPRVTFNYLGQFDAPRDALLTPRFGGAGCERDPAGPLGNTLAIHAYIDTDGARSLKLHWVYAETQFDRTTIETLAQRFETALLGIVAACAARLAVQGGGATPGDYPLAREAGLNQATLDRLPHDLRSIDDIYPLSPMQQGILFHSLLAPEHATYINQLVATLHTPDVQRLRTAFEAAVPRHDILRTSFMTGEATPMQIVHRQARMPVDTLDWRGEGELALEAWLANDRARGFDLSRPPLMRVTLIHVADDEWKLVWTRHHLLLDGWSTARLFADILRDYMEPPRPHFAMPAKARYRDFIAWLAKRDTNAEKTVWLERLALLDEPVLVAKREADMQTGNRSWRATFDASATARAVDTARSLHITLNTLIQGAWALALQRVTHQSSVAFGATVAGRPDALPDVDTVLGLFINTLPVITAPLPQREAATWLRELQATNAAAAEHAHTPLADIQQWAGQGGGALFDTLLVFENYPVDEAWAGRDERSLKMRDLRNIESTDFAVTLVIEAGESMIIDYGYDAARIDEKRVAMLHRAFSACLDALVENPHALLGGISIASPDDIAKVARFNATTRISPAQQQLSLHRQFELAAKVSAHAIALEFADATGELHRMSYSELDAEANRVAAALVAKGVAPDTVVALCVERSFDMVVALMGVLKAGAAYLPIDPEYPAERIAYVLKDAQPAMVLTQAHLRERINTDDARVFTVAELMQDDATPAARADVHPQQLAYLIYTSGSTGKPKGAGNTHGALSNRIAWMQRAYTLTDRDVVLHKTPFGFDVSVWEFVWPLSVGAKLAIAAPGDHRDPARLVAAIEARGVTTLHFVPSMLAAFIAHLDDFNAAGRCASLQRIIASGEALAPELVARVAQLLPNARLYNLYGPTEAAIDVSHWTCSADDGNAVSVPIGHAIDNLQLHVLDAAMHPLPDGVIGELYLGGAGLARGYLGRPALTAKRFVPDPFVAGARLYRTGDLACRRSDGALDYLGRIDTQVKLRGQRIEPGEIEALLRAYPGVHDAVVIVRDEQLVAYVARGAEGSLDQAALRNALRAQLPPYMVPARVIELAALPVTPNGKCDRNALPVPAREDHPVELPRSSTEQDLAAIWQRVLRVESVGRDDDFFVLGGHSLLATQANAQANLHWSLMLPLRTLFDQRTLARCAAEIDRVLDERGDAHGQNALSAIDALLGELEAQ